MNEPITLDFRACRTVGELYRILRNQMAWQPWYGETLDALYDVLTGLPHRGGSFCIYLPESEDVADYARRMCRVFRAAADECGLSVRVLNP